MHRSLEEAIESLSSEAITEFGHPPFVQERWNYAFLASYPELPSHLQENFQSVNSQGCDKNGPPELQATCCPQQTLHTRDGNLLPNTSEGQSSEAVQQVVQTARWSQDEHERFLAALKEFGTKRPAGNKQTGLKFGGGGLGRGIAKLIARRVETRTVSQVRSHAQKYFLRNLC
eukprot:751470-Hanusia_phi.AAC.6